MNNSNHDKLNGTMNRAKGSIKEGTGKLIGNPKLESEGKTDKMKGRLQSAVGDAKEAVKSTLNKASDALKR